MGFRSWFQSQFSRRRNITPIVSFVLLLREPRPLTIGDLAATVRRALGIEIWTGFDEPRGDNYILEEVEPSYIVQLKERTFRVTNSPTPYLSESEWTAVEIAEPRLRRAVVEHRAWLSVNLLRGDWKGYVLDPDEVHAAYRIIGPLVAELADDVALVLIEHETGRMNVYGPALDAELRGPDPRHALIVPAHILAPAIKDDDPRMIAAVEEARDRWSEFVDAFDHRRPGQVFSAKVWIAEGAVSESMWVSVTALEGDYLYGKLDNTPIRLRNARLGSRIRAAVADLNDWTFLEANRLRGGFTIEVLRRLREGG